MEFSEVVTILHLCYLKLKRSGEERGKTGDEEIRVPVTEEEEVVVEKRPVAKEEVRVRKNVVGYTRLSRRT